MRTRIALLLLPGWLLVVGAAFAQEAITASGVIESSSGGFRFPDGTVQATAADDYAKVVVVAEAGGDFTSIQDAVDSIGDAAEANRYLVWVAPGLYSEQVTMIDYVDIAGSGPLATRITSPISPTVACADDGELRDLSVATTQIGGTAIDCTGSAPRLTRVQAVIEGSAGTCTGVSAGAGAAPRLRDVEVVADSGCSSRALESSDAEPRVDGLDVSIVGAGQSRAVYVREGFLRLRGLRAEVESEGRVYGVTAYDTEVEAFDVEIRLAGGENSYGMSFNEASEGRVVGAIVEITSSGDGNAYGLLAAGDSEVHIQRASLRVVESGLEGTGYGAAARTGGGLRASETEIAVERFATGYGVYVGISGSRFEGRAIGVRSVGAITNYGAFLSLGGMSLVIDGSSIRSDGDTVQADAGTATIAGSRLDGDPVDANGGTIVCAGVWDELLAFSSAICP